MKRLRKKWVVFLLAFAMLLTSSNLAVVPEQTVYAASTKIITGSTQVICKQSAMVKAPRGYGNCRFSSSNKKVASVNAKGKLKALRLGVTKITVYSNKKKQSYKITVVPKSDKDVRLKQSLFLKGQTDIQLKLTSNVYDTSQVKLHTSGSTYFSSNGYCTEIPKIDGLISDTFIISYGSWEKTVAAGSVETGELKEAIQKPDGQYACAEKQVSYDGKLGMYTLDELKMGGIAVTIDNKPLQKQMVYTAGTHWLNICGGNYTMRYQYDVNYSVLDNLRNHTTKGFDEDCAQVLNVVYKILDEIITPDMTDEQKVKAIHDYLIYNANYYHGKLSDRQGWSSAVKGVLMEHEGVCNSYALAFYTMITAEGIPCRYISGISTNSVGKTGGHAWNQVKVGDKWYYIDCTWDDPTGGGFERTTYYLSEQLWSNHKQETSKDPVTEDFYLWENFYLTGKGWDK